MNQITKPHILALANNKGGCGKSTSAAYLGGTLARMGFYVTMIDFDPQGDLETFLGASVHDAGITTEQSIVGSNIRWLSTRISPHIRLTPSTPKLQNIETMLLSTSEPDIVKRVSQKIPYGIEQGTGFVIIDCPPALNNLTRAAFTIADTIIIPTNPVPADMKALTRTYEYANLIAGSSHKLIKILFTRDQHYKLNEDAISAINEILPGLPFRQSISATVQMEETAIRGALREPLKRNTGAADYVEVTKELLEITGLKPKEEVQYE